MNRSTPSSVLDLPPIWIELDTRLAFGLSYALGLFLRHVGGPSTAIQEELAGLAAFLREQLPPQCRELVEVLPCLPIPESLER